MGQQTADVLWVDDEADPAGAEARGLALQGYRLTCARTGLEGVRLARSGQFRVIVLDLRLPDVHGLDVLAALRAEQVATPVVLLTGFGDFESARRSGFLGALGYEAKPLDLERWLEIVRTLGHQGEANPGDVPDMSEALVRLVRKIDTVAMAVPGQPTGLTRRDLLAAELLGHSGPLLWVLLDALMCGYAVPIFLACAQAFREAATRGFGADSAARARLLINRASRIRTREASNASGRLLAALVASRRPHTVRVAEIACQLALDAGDLSRGLSAETGIGFRTWRSGVVMERAARWLTAPEKSISEVAWEVGYEHLSGFDRDFHAVMGLAPSVFRKLSNLRSR